MSVGSGGASTRSFVSDIIFSRLGNEILNKASDSAILDVSSKTAFTTDSYVVRPEFFPGGDIGKISICGTVNDLLVSGAVPKYLSFGLIVPEGYLVSDLERILDSMAAECRKAGVKVVCGDTKVVEKGAVDGLIINTSGIGDAVYNYTDVSNIKEGDAVIITSDIARHGMSVMLARGELGFEGEILSDCACLLDIFESIAGMNVKFARDATRGGVAAVLNEIASDCGLGFLMKESDIPIHENVGYLCDMLGFDPLAVANEGLAVIIVEQGEAEAVLEKIKNCESGKRASVCGIVEGKNVVLETAIGGKRHIEMPSGELLPRIC
ncbi:MAG: hydrogenase expression/formation protein HypE [Denitrovibrio sp.]|nr:MAG: hydrogenase expression/formation protein HypE [Denitrovibrio sp.]